jgi:Flp pilus assembly protein TadD
MTLGAFLWPYATESHIHNQVYDFAPHYGDGPFPEESGDNYMNRMIASGTPTDAAVSRYLALDIAKQANLDRLLELHLAAQRQRDEIAGIEVADIIEAYFCKERLFASRGHPHLRLYTALAMGVFRKLGFAESAIEEGTARMPDGWPDHYTVPMHPRLIEHYRLEWLQPDATYFDYWSGPRTFRQWCRQYMDYDWNRDLHEGIFLVYHPERGDPLPYLERGLVRAPSSPVGLRTMADLLMRRGHPDEAEAAMRQASRLDPADALPRLAALLWELGKLDEAEATLRSVIARLPKQSRGYISLAEFLRVRGRGTEALDLVSRGTALLRHQDPKAHCTVGERLLRAGEIAEAERAFRVALAMVPMHREALWGLAEALLRQGRSTEAHEMLRQLREVEPDEPQIHHRMGLMLSGFGDSPEAIRCFRAVIAKQPEYPGAREELARLLGDNPDTLEEALALLRPLTESDDRNFVATALMGHASSRTGDIAGGARYFRLALDMVPNNAEIMMALAYELARLGRAGEIPPFYKRYKEAGGSGSPVHNRIGEIMLAAGDLATAETAFEAVLGENPADEAASAGLAKVRALAAEVSLAAQ